MTLLQTERLMLRPLVPADAEAYAAMRFHQPFRDSEPQPAAR